MPTALADFFFIAGLEGHEPSIAPKTSILRADTLKDSSSTPEPILEEPTRETQLNEVNNSTVPETREQTRTSVVINEGPDTVSKLEGGMPSIPPMASLPDFLSENGTGSGIFEDVMAKFASERDEFLLTLAPPSIPITPPATTPIPTVTEEEEDHVPELNYDGHAPSPLRARSSLRSKVESISRRVSRSSTIRRANTTVSRKSSKRSSVVYNNVIPTPEPLLLPAGTHPLKRKFQPKLLGVWPTSSMKEEIVERGNAPDYLPMFAFPNDIQVRLSDERPRSTWHGFTMTKANGDKVHVCCITIWHQVPPSIAADLENQCHEWRQGNLSLEERELAASLGEKLAGERALLSSLLQQLPALTGYEREEVDEQILHCEEKITLYNELLKPVRLHAAAKVEGLTEGQGMWIPRSYGLLGREGSYQTVWREWLRAICVPYVLGEVDLDIINSQGGKFLPLERYLVNLCGEVPLPIQGKNQVEIAVRELRLYASKEDVNEIPGWRDTDLYPLFRALSLKNIITLYEAAISEARIIFRSSFPAMLHSAARALVQLLWPFKFTGIYIPILPSRLLSALEAPVSYIIGIDRKYERLELPTDDFVLCDLDQDFLMYSTRPTQLPPTTRHKLGNLLSLAVRIHLTRGVSVGPPAYVQECYPKNCFTADRTVTSSKRQPATYGRFVGTRSLAFGDGSSDAPADPPVFNAFEHSARQEDRELREFLCGPTSNGTVKSINSVTGFDSGKYATVSSSRPSFSSSSTLRDITSSLRNPSNRASGMWGSFGRNSDKNVYPSSMHTTNSGFFSRKGFSDTASVNGYAVSISQSSTAASSILNFDALAMPIKKVEDSEMHQWREGHSFRWKQRPEPCDCEVCYEPNGGGIYICDDCHLTVHQHCLDAVTLPCLSAANFSPDRIRATFLRCFASLLYNYRKYLEPVPSGQRKSDGKLFNFKLQLFLRSAPRDTAPFLEMLSETQAFNEFIMERCMKSPDDPEIALFDEIILAKRNRGRHSLFGGKQVTPLLSTISASLETKKTVPPNDTKLPALWQPPETPPSKLDPLLLLPPRLAQPPRSKYHREKGMIKRKPVNKSDETIRAAKETTV